jgi:hypothetical protein
VHSGGKPIVGGGETSKRVVSLGGSGDEGTLGECGSKQQVSFEVWDMLDI